MSVSLSLTLIDFCFYSQQPFKGSKRQQQIVTGNPICLGLFWQQPCRDYVSISWTLKVQPPFGNWDTHTILCTHTGSPSFSIYIKTKGPQRSLKLLGKNTCPHDYQNSCLNYTFLPCIICSITFYLDIYAFTLELLNNNTYIPLRL